jgi:hypothetical protein
VNYSNSGNKKVSFVDNIENKKSFQTEGLEVKKKHKRVKIVLDNFE